MFRNWLTPGMVNSIIFAKLILVEAFSIIFQPIIFRNWLRPGMFNSLKPISNDISTNIYKLTHTWDGQQSETAVFSGPSRPKKGLQI